MTDEAKALVECVRLHRHWKNSCGDLDNAPFLLCDRIEQFKQALTYIRDTTTCEHAHCAAGEALEWSAIAALEGKQ